MSKFQKFILKSSISIQEANIEDLFIDLPGKGHMKVLKIELVKRNHFLNMKKLKNIRSKTNKKDEIWNKKKFEIRNQKSEILRTEKFNKYNK